MNKMELTQRIAKRFGFMQREATTIVDAILSAVAQELENGRRVEIRGLGTWGTRQRKASVGRVVKTGERVEVPSLRRVFFRPGQELKEIHAK
ncbi:MAG: integration host factor subunit beta [Candidatus Firestonebacteria bacterium]|nr:integration host factor subunit beta [Candidatus Firestonebacteria bacterium]